MSSQYISSYADYIVNHPEEAQLVCACDVLSERLAQYGEKYQIPKERCFEDAQTMPDTVEGLDLVIVSVLEEGGVAKLPDRTAFAGSVATADRLVRTMVQIAGVPLVDAVKMMTLTLAKVMRLDEKKGSIAVGKDADIVVFDENINIKMVMIGGRLQIHP